MFHVAHRLPLPQRAQRSGLCYMDAPAVVQHYLVALHQPNVGMIDLTKFVLQCFSASELERHIFDNAGGDSHTLLHRILMPGSCTVSTNSFDISLKQYGPGLVSGFKVHGDFNAGKSVSFDGEPEGEVMGVHAWY